MVDGKNLRSIDKILMYHCEEMLFYSRNILEVWFVTIKDFLVNLYSLVKANGNIVGDARWNLKTLRPGEYNHRKEKRRKFNKHKLRWSRCCEKGFAKTEKQVEKPTYNLRLELQSE